MPMMAACEELGDNSQPADYPLYIVDAFTKKPFAGNPAAVCLLKNVEDIPNEMKYKVAAEMNLSETAFVSCRAASDTFSHAERFGLRWFTPTVEVNLCGHATLAAATIIFNVCNNPHRELKFETLSGTLLAIRKGNSIALDFPQNPPRLVTHEERSDLQPLIDLSCGSLGSDAVEDVWLSPSAAKLLVRLKDTVTMSDLENCLVKADKMIPTDSSGKVKGVILTVKGSRENGAVDCEGTVYDFISRYFAPWYGINEDPVTGSSHTVLAPYFAKVLGKNMMYARQCSKRGGDLLLVIHPNNRMEIAGHSRVVMSGKLHI